MQGLYPNWMAESSLIRQGVAEVNALMGARDVIVDVTAAATDGGWGGGTGGTIITKVFDTGTSDGSPPETKYRDRPWPIVLVRKVLSKEEDDIDVIVLEINGLKV